VRDATTRRVWLVAISATALTVGLMVAVAFTTTAVTAVLVPLAVIGAAIAALAVPALLPEPEPETEHRLTRGQLRQRSILAQVVFADCRVDRIDLDCVVSRANPNLPDLPSGLPFHVALAVPESGILAALSGSLFERWCREPGLIEVELAPQSSPPRATVCKGDARILFEVRTASNAGG
jgi:hypothetical protein